MKHINCWNDLSRFGIVLLTGEACGLSYRLLCDVTERGRKVLQKAFGLPNMALAEPWNGGTPQDPHVGSIMLAPEMLLPVGVFALLEHDCIEAWSCKNGTLLGIEANDPSDSVEALANFMQEEIRRRFAYRGTARDRNVHEMTGRTE